MRYWIFNVNSNSNILNGIRLLDTLYWLITRYKKEITYGDKIVIYVSGIDAGIYALGEIQEFPCILEDAPDTDIWRIITVKNKKYYSPVLIKKKYLFNPLLKSKLLNDSVLCNLQVFKEPCNFNFRITLSEWNRIQELLECGAVDKHKQ